MKRNLYLSKLLLLLGILLTGLSSSTFAQPVMTTFGYVGDSVQRFVVPAGVTRIRFDAQGAGGGQNSDEASYPDRGGFGGRVTGGLTVTPGQTLFIVIGNMGGNGAATIGGTNGINGGAHGGSDGTFGGGGGGGATDIRSGGNTIANRVVVAAGGGGAGLDGVTADADRGGDANGIAGENGQSATVLAFGSGGTAVMGGAGATCPTCTGVGVGATGTLGAGGNADLASSGGGGGGGYFGGGGGRYGGGGAGADFAIMTSTDSVTYFAAANAGDGSLIISFDCVAAVDTLMGMSPICRGTSTTFSNDSTGGTFISGNPAVATVDPTSGLVSGINAGTATISYIFTGTCGTATATRDITVETPIIPGIIMGTSPICNGSTTTFTSTATGGAFSSSNPAVATVDSASGLVTAISMGTAVISYTDSNTCGAAVASRNVTVEDSTHVDSIMGPNNPLCTGMIVNFTDDSTGGTFSSSNPAIISITPMGAATPIAVGTAVISYTMMNSCNTATATRNIVTEAPPTPGVIFGTSPICRGTTTTYTSSGTEGVFSSSDSAIATVDSVTGLVTGVSAGMATISYSAASSCATYVSTQDVTVQDTPHVGTLTGASPICAGSTTHFTSDSTGGVFSSSNPLVATVDTAGNVTGIMTGTATISYTDSNSCGVARVTRDVTVQDSARADSITGLSTVCVGMSTPFIETATGGTFSSSNPAVATVDSTGNVTGVAPGTATISYTDSNSCSMAMAVRTITVQDSLRGMMLTGRDSICMGTTTTLTADSTGGIFTSSNPAVATVTGTGDSATVTGITMGTTVISYTRTSACGTVSDTLRVSVQDSARADSITGLSTVCVGMSTPFIETATGGTFTSSNPAVATVDSTGNVTGVSAGTATISYTDSTSCNTATASKTITVRDTLRAMMLTGRDSICMGTTTTISADSTGGIFTSSNPAIATVTGTGDSATVAGITMGTAVISYTRTSACGTVSDTLRVSVQDSARADSITGLSTVCVGMSTPFIETATGGTFSSSNPAVATVDSTTGSVTGVAPGTATISYTDSTSCNMAMATKTITVQDTLRAMMLTGNDTICRTSTTTLTADSTGGIFSSSNSAVATVTATGDTATVTGVTMGTAVISYTRTNMCGTVSDTATVTVRDTVSSGTLTSANDTICRGSSVTFTADSMGGTFTSANPAVATVNPTSGMVTGISAGTTTISYNTMNACSAANASSPVTVQDPMTARSLMGGTAPICVGTIRRLTDSATGGTFSSADTAVASVDSMGNVRGVSAGNALISYSRTNTCGTVFDTLTVNVQNDTMRMTLVSSRGDSVCIGDSTRIIANPGGTFSSSNTAVATVDTTGNVTGVSTGSAIISYTRSTTCGSVSDTITIFVRDNLRGRSLTSTSPVCAGTTQVLTDTIPGGTFSSSNTAVATVSGSDSLHAISAGTSVISYTRTGMCNTVADTFIVTVQAPLTARTITGDTAMGLCQGSTVTLADSNMGGMFHSSDTSIAAIDSMSGTVTGIAPGTATISYTSSNSCGSLTDTMRFTVHGKPVFVADATASLSLCNSTSDTFNYHVMTVDGDSISSLRGPVVGIDFSYGDSVIHDALVNITDFDLTVPYYFTATSPFGCQSFDTIYVVVHPAVHFASHTGTTDSETICSGGVFTFNDTTNIPGATITYMRSSAAGVYSASADSGRSNINDTLVNTTRTPVVVTYIFTASQGAGCSVNDTVIVTVNPNPALLNTPSDSVICSGGTFTFNPSVTAGAGFVWERLFTPGIASSGATGTGNISETLTNVTTFAVPVTYTFTVTACGRDTVQSITIRVLPSITINRGLATDTICSGTAFAFNPTIMPASYLDSILFLVSSSTSGVTFSNTSHGDTISGTLTSTLSTAVNVSVYINANLEGCGSGDDTLHVVVEPGPGVPAISIHPPSSLCGNTMYQNFGASTEPGTGITYTWTATDAAVNATGSTKQYSLVSFYPGEASVKLTATGGGFGCSSSDSFAVHVSNNISDNVNVYFINGNQLIALPSDEQTYQWGYDDASTLDSTIIPGEVNQTYFNTSFDFTGRYYWVMTTHNGCMQKSYYNAPTGVTAPATAASGMKLYPNPASDQVTIELTGNVKGAATVEIWNTLGEKVATAVTVNNKVMIDVAGLPAGMYLVGSYSDGVKTAAARFIKN